jgi:hypothetical protein
MDVGLPEEGNITEMYKFGDDRLLLIKERAAYEFTFADRLDPERTNEALPNVQQRILNAGSEHDLVQKILLTSDALLDPTYFPNFDCGRLREHALNAVREMLAMQRIADRLASERDGLLRELDGKRLSNGFIIPSLSDLEQEVKNFLQRMDHFSKEAFQILRALEPRFANPDKLLGEAEKEDPRDEAFIEFVGRAIPFLRFVREARNAMEHPTGHKRVSVFDFELDRSGQLISPSIEVVHPKYKEPRVDVIAFSSAMISSLAGVYGEALAIVGGRRAIFGPFPLAVAKLPQAKRKYPGVAYSYVMNINGEWQPIG